MNEEQIKKATDYLDKNFTQHPLAYKREYKIEEFEKDRLVLSFNINGGLSNSRLERIYKEFKFEGDRIISMIDFINHK